jgi:hypothetical protein
VWRRGWKSRSKLDRADWVRMEVMPQFESQVPDPLGNQLPALLSPGRVAAPSIGVDFLVFISEHRLKAPAMQVQLDDIAGGECLLRQVREEELVDDAFSCDPNRTLLFACRMGGHDDAAGHAIGSHRDLETIIEATDHLAFGALELIGRQVQPRRNARVIEQAIVLATGHKREPCQIGEHRPIAILPIEPEQRVRSFEVIRCQISANGCESLAQFFPIASIPAVPKRAEPVVAMRLRDGCACPNHLPTLAARARPGAQTSSNRRKGGGRSSVCGKARCRAASRVPSMSKTVQE